MAVVSGAKAAYDQRVCLGYTLSNCNLYGGMAFIAKQQRDLDNRNLGNKTEEIASKKAEYNEIQPGMR